MSASLPKKLVLRFSMSDQDALPASMGASFAFVHIFSRVPRPKSTSGTLFKHELYPDESRQRNT